MTSRRKRKAHHVLQRMSVDGDDTDGSGPLVVLFVVMLVEAGLVEQPEEIKRNKLNTSNDRTLSCVKVCAMRWQRL